METVTFTRTPARNHETGDREGTPTEVVEAPMAIEPVSASQVPTRSSDRKAAEFRLYSTDTDLPVLSGDTATFRGKDHTVDGDPEVWINPFTGVRAGCVVNAWRYAG